MSRDEFMVTVVRGLPPGTISRRSRLTVGLPELPVEAVPRPARRLLKSAPNAGMLKDANARRAQQASDAAVTVIERALAHGVGDRLPGTELEMAQLRVRGPHCSFEDRGRLASPPLS